ncbi:phosphatidylinositol N-acetylglucosaminyltransferase [Cordyceps militaris CM01]|uniref:Phosphatidylinositol N-acetylglucosaminyltransferase n=2 Tax=Cordyceps militaris TaxID=73501 RepID=G3JA63_CORMM|nr:phosphatidylinositol N-acetylglucosaminyltransferase [Cordyceps militaris CM01]ATY60862.1 phosphatidylinositol N-acetylglucosaminyltransferase [Cordyceps militaris]EGX94233.1 phosphatidylinositol N-acetylglucosaminyltransferase [Cordyceps militaris CM01]
MLTTPPRLQIRRPSPTTTEFTVTTQPPSTLALRLLRILLLLLRVGLALATILLVEARWSGSPLASPPPAHPLTLPPDLLTADTLFWARDVLHRHAAGQGLARVAAAVPLPLLLPAAALALRLLSRRVHAAESLLVMRGLGVQTRESAPGYFARAATRFIPTEKIRDILVNEAFRGFEVRYYLVVVVDGEEDLVVVFPGLLPPRRIVEAVWRGARECLYEKRDEKTPIL